MTKFTKECTLVEIYGIRMIKIFKEKISTKEVGSLLGDPFSDMVKFVVDVKKGVLAFGGELHSDAEALLLQNGSSQTDVWGGNYYPANPKGQQVQFTSMINIRPRQGNRSMEVKDEVIKNQIMSVLDRLLP